MKEEDKIRESLIGLGYASNVDFVLQGVEVGLRSCGEKKTILRMKDNMDNNQYHGNWNWVDSSLIPLELLGRISKELSEAGVTAQDIEYIFRGSLWPVVGDRDG